MDGTQVGPFPATAAGGHLEWYFAVRERGVATADEIDAHFAPEYRWAWGSPRDSDALELWFGRWRSMRASIETVEALAADRYVVTTRLEGGAVARVWFEMEGNPPHRILRTSTTEHEPSDGPVDFGEATAVTASDGSDGDGAAADSDGAGSDRALIPAVFTTAVGPFGGYVAALAVAVAGHYSDKSTPVSMSGHFLNTGRAGAVQVERTTLRSSSRLESMTITLRQGAVLFESLVWGAEPASGPAHGLYAMPSVPSPASAVKELPEGRPFESFGGTMEAIPVEVEGDASTAAAWVRLRPRARFDDNWTDAARLLLPIDWLAVNASVRPHHERDGFVVPSTLDISVGFHNRDRDTEWVLCRAESPVAGRGLATSTASVWSEDGHLLATAALQILHRGT